MHSILLGSNLKLEFSPSFLEQTSNPEKLMPVASWDIFVIDEPKINAFVLPSTDIFVYTGLLALVEDDEALLASVIAHEISHVTERHSVESLGFLALSGVAFDVLRGASWALTISFPVVSSLSDSSFLRELANNAGCFKTGRRCTGGVLQLSG